MSSRRKCADPFAKYRSKATKKAEEIVESDSEDQEEQEDSEMELEKPSSEKLSSKSAQRKPKVNEVERNPKQKPKKPILTYDEEMHSESEDESEEPEIHEDDSEDSEDEEQDAADTEETDSEVESRTTKKTVTDRKRSDPKQGTKQNQDTKKKAVPSDSKKDNPSGKADKAKPKKSSEEDESDEKDASKNRKRKIDDISEIPNFDYDTLDRLNVSALRNLAKANDIHVASKAKRQDIIVAIAEGKGGELPDKLPSPPVKKRKGKNEEEGEKVKGATILDKFNELKQGINSQDLEQLTVQQIKELIRSLHIIPEKQKIPSLSKQALIKWVLALIKESKKSEKGFKKIATPKIPFSELQHVLKPNNDDHKLSGRWKKDLNHDGWTTIYDMIDSKTLESVKSQMYEWMSSCNSEIPFDLHDETTHDYKLMPCVHGGNFRSGAGQEEFMWNLREKTKEAWFKIHRTDDLVASFDGFAFLSSHSANTKRKESANPGEACFIPNVESDHPSDEDERLCIQGIIPLTTLGEDQGGLAFYLPDLPEEDESDGKYHFLHFHQQYIEDHPSYGHHSGTKFDYNYAAIKNIPLKKVNAPAGSLILFDSRLFHCIVPSNSETPSLFAYVSFQPRSYLSEAESKKRVTLFKEGRQTGPWCCGSRFVVHPKATRAFGNEKPKDAKKHFTVELEDVEDMV